LKIDIGVRKKKIGSVQILVQQISWPNSFLLTWESSFWSPNMSLRISLGSGIGGRISIFSLQEKKRFR